MSFAANPHDVNPRVAAWTSKRRFCEEADAGARLFCCITPAGLYLTEALGGSYLGASRQAYLRQGFPKVAGPLDFLIAAPEYHTPWFSILSGGDVCSLGSMRTGRWLPAIIIIRIVSFFSLLL